MGTKRTKASGIITMLVAALFVAAAFDNGFECLVPRDACAAKALTHEGRSIPARNVHAAFLAALDGTYAQVLNAEGIIARLSGGAV